MSRSARDVERLFAPQPQRVGTQIGRADSYIAAICVTHSATLATRNTKDFESYPKLRVIDPWTP